jgi:signal transduction histidine kinase/ligand-binding sensor domain-containing protein/DNA-binding response OmpR family regulator
MPRFYKLFLIVILLGSCSNPDKIYEQQKKTLPAHRDHSTLSFLNVNAFCEDSLGYMWIATLGGLNRYNGYEFMHYVYDAEDSTSLNDNFVFSLMSDSSNRLWVGTTSGVNCYNLETDSFIRYSGNSAAIYSFYEDHTGRIWVASPNGTGWLDTEKREVVFSPEKRNINLYWEDSSSNLWLGASENQGLATLKYDDSWELYSLPGNRWVICRYSDPQGVWWLGTNAGITLFDPVSRTFMEPPYPFLENTALSKTQINFIREIEPLKLLIGTSSQGLFLYDILSRTIQHNEPSRLNPYHSSQLLSCYIDKEENVWVGSYDKGFAVGNNHSAYFNADRVLSDAFRGKFVTRVAEDKFHNLWIGTRYDGLWCYTSDKKLIPYNSENSKWFLGGTNFLESLFIDSEDRIWIGFDNYLVVGHISADGNIESCEQIDLKHVRVIKEDDQGNMWLGTWNALFRIDNKWSGNSIQKIYPVTGDANITDICIRKSGEILFSSYGEGVFRIGRSNIIPEIYHSPFATTPILSRCITIFEDSHQRIWVGSYVNGAMCISEGEYTTFTYKNGLPDNNVLSFQEDMNGCIWMSTSYGISKLKFSPADTIVTNYFSIDGTLGDQYHEKAGLRHSDGQIFFAGNHGLTFFNPNDIIPNRNSPLVHLEDLKISNQSVQPEIKGSILTKSITLTDKITLNHKQTNISLEYAGIDFIAPEKLHYKYRMEGLDSEWNYVGSSRRASYSKLPSGNYIFKVIAINGDGVESLRPATLEIRVKPTPWFSWPALILYALLLGSIIVMILRFWFNAKMSRQKLEFEHNEREREHEISEMKTNFFSNISHELRTPLTLISAPLEQLMKLKSGDSASMGLLNTISRNVRSMLRLIDQLLDFGKLDNGVLSLHVQQSDLIQQIRNIMNAFAYTATRQRINLQFNPHVSAINLWIDSDKLEKILHNLLSNALKYTPANGSVEIRTNELDSETANKKYSGTHQMQGINFVEISVLDTGSGISPDKLSELFIRYRRIEGHLGFMPDYGGSGLGLHYTKKIVEKHGGRICAQIRSGGGMEFSFILSIDDIYLDEEKSSAPTEIVLEGTDKAMLPINESTEQTHQYTILIAEDNVELMDFIKTILCDQYRLIEALDGNKAWELAQSESVDLILSDVLMLGMSGYQLCSLVKEDPALCHIPVILLTAKTSIQDQVEGLKQGADAYICKPFNIDYLLITIKNLFMSRDRLRHYLSMPHIQANLPIPVKLNQYDRKFLDKLSSLLENELSNPNLNIDYIARNMGFSRTGFYSKIKGLTDMSPIDFLTSYRMRCAAEKIVQNEYSLTEIAEQTGFSSYSYFSKTFKKHFGITPNKYIP